MQGERVKTVKEMRDTLAEAVNIVQAGKGCLVEALMEK
jgi:hypothetical protein